MAFLFQVLLSSAKEMKWSHVTILHEDEEYSISVTKLLTQAAATGGSTCITGIHSLPRVTTRYSRKELRPFRKAFKAATTGLGEGSAVIVISRNSETTDRFLQVVNCSSLFVYVKFFGESSVTQGDSKIHGTNS